MGYDFPREYDDSDAEVYLKHHSRLSWRDADESYFASVDSVKCQVGPNGGPPLMEQDICASPAGQWVYVLLPYCVQARGGMDWTFVNYKEQRMYLGPCVKEAFSWKGRDVFHINTWDRLTSMEAIENVGRN
jgi:hypothetical protein